MRKRARNEVEHEMKLREHKTYKIIVLYCTI